MKFLRTKYRYSTLPRKVAIGLLLLLVNWGWGLEKGIALSPPIEELSGNLGRIISVEGIVKVRRNNEVYPAEEAFKIYKGDIITTDRLSHVTLLYLHEIAEISENQEVTITDEIPSLERGGLAKLRNVLHAAYINLEATLFPPPILSSPGASRKWLPFAEERIIDLVNPVATKIMTPYPCFKWLPIQGVEEYECIIFDGAGRVLWRCITNHTELTYPHEAPSLSSDEYYFWQVRRADKRQEYTPSEDLYIPYGIAYFSIMNPEKVAEIKETVREVEQNIRAEDEVSTLLLSIYYEKQELYEEALRHYESLIHIFPKNTIYKNMRAHLYLKIGRKWAAAKLLED